MMYPEDQATMEWGTSFYHKDEVLTKHIGECTTNVLGSSVIFTCEGDYINEHVYHDASTGAVPESPDCSGDVLYVMPIANTCNSYDWGSMDASWTDYCMTPKADEWTFTVSMVMNEGCETMMYPEDQATMEWGTSFYHVDEVLTRPIGECTTNVLGSSVIFTCEGDYINEHVYIDASTGAAPETPDCSGDVLYVMPIRNTCNSYDWGSMDATWTDYCMTPKSCTQDSDCGEYPTFCELSTGTCNWLDGYWQVANSYTCYGMVLAASEDDDDDALMASMNALYGDKNCGMWPSDVDLADMQRYCTETFGEPTCGDSITCITSSNADLSYCDANCVEAINGLQEIHDSKGVCPDWALQHYYGFETPEQDFNCSLLAEAEGDNTAEYPSRADVQGECEECVSASCLSDQW